MHSHAFHFKLDSFKNVEVLKPFKQLLSLKENLILLFGLYKPSPKLPSMFPFSRHLEKSCKNRLVGKNRHDLTD